MANKIEFEERKAVYADALRTWGADAQLVVALEELSECAKEICKALRGKVNIGNLAEEVADATIMLEQVRQMFAINGRVCTIMDSKIERLHDRLEEYRRTNDVQ